MSKSPNPYGTPELTGLPQNAMKCLVKHLDYSEQFRLLRTCRHLNENLPIKIPVIIIIFSGKNVQVYLQKELEIPPEYTKIEYDTCHDVYGTYIGCKLWESRNFQRQGRGNPGFHAARFLGRLFSRKFLEISGICVDFSASENHSENKISEFFEILKSRVSEFPVKTLCVSEIPKNLIFNFFEIFHISEFSSNNEKSGIEDLEILAKLNSWKFLEVLNFEKLAIVPKYESNFAHLKSITLTVVLLTVPDLIEIKEAFMTSTILQLYLVYCNGLSSAMLIEAFGFGIENSGMTITWAFPIIDTPQILFIEYFIKSEFQKKSHVDFRRIG